MEPKALIAQGDQLFGKRGTLLNLWQEIAENFYPERADFTVNRTMGNDFADNLTTSYPLLVRRDLGNSFSTMLRPTSTDWFHMGATPDELDQPGRAWLEAASVRMRKAMYNRATLFTRATKEGDHDFASFGQCVLSVEPNRNHDQLLYRCWHLRDVAWCEDAEGKVGTVHRKWKPSAIDLKAVFRDKVHPKVTECMTGSSDSKRPYTEFECRHIILPTELYDDSINPEKTPYVSVYLDVANAHIMEAVPQTYNKYVIPRWQTVSGSQYAYSPATVAGLPDARLIQAMTRVLLEAGEKATNPPMIAVQEAIRSDISIYAGGVTWVDAAYDEREGAVLRPITQDKSGIPLGVDMQRDTRAMLQEAFYLNKLTLPQGGPDMTAYEVGQRIQEYIRAAAPIFEPMELEYNGGLCEATFHVMLKAGAFASLGAVPESIAGQDVGWRFESPLHDAVEKAKGQVFVEVKGILADTLSLDPTIAADIDVKTAFRDVMAAIGAPAKWLRPEDQAAAMVKEQVDKANADKLIEQVTAGATAAEQVGKAGQALGVGADPTQLAA